MRTLGWTFLLALPLTFAQSCGHESDLWRACEDYCDKLETCGFEDTQWSSGHCVDQCSRELDNDGRHCSAAQSGYYSCLGSLTCPEMSYDMNGYCATELSDADAICGP